jgi:hypothetical protein
MARSSAIGRLILRADVHTAPDLGDAHETVRVGGVGGCYGPSDLERRSTRMLAAEIHGFLESHLSAESRG